MPRRASEASRVFRQLKPPRRPQKQPCASANRSRCSTTTTRITPNTAPLGFGKVITTTITSEDDTTAAWRTAANWIGANAISVPAQYYKRYDGSAPATDSRQLSNPPLCIIQRIVTTSTPAFNGYLITGRGFANNAKFDATTGKTTYGAEAFVQSILSNS